MVVFGYNVSRVWLALLASRLLLGRPAHLVDPLRVGARRSVDILLHGASRMGGVVSNHDNVPSARSDGVANFFDPVAMARSGAPVATCARIVERAREDGYAGGLAVFALSRIQLAMGFLPHDPFLDRRLLFLCIVFVDTAGDEIAKTILVVHKYCNDPFFVKPVDARIFLFA